MYYVLFYDYVEDILTKRAPFREQHLALIRQLHERKQVVMGGAFDNPVDGAMIIFRADDTKPIESFVASDPYAKNGLVKKWRIRNWNVVIGGEG
ncbi:MAG: hypothetical protein EXR67_04015 [Dehalococcoidia bacterium]|nr:hypothetical protein [Dehalococcoidia bacterium]